MATHDKFPAASVARRGPASCLWPPLCGVAFAAALLTIAGSAAVRSAPSVPPSDRAAEAPVCDVVFSPTHGAGALQATLAREIRRARDTLAIALYSGMTAALAREVAEASNRCRVRIIADEDALVADPDVCEGGAPRWLEILSRAGVAVRVMKIAFPSGESRPAFHHKFAVVDGRTVLTGSYNWSARGDGLNYENLVVIRDRDLAGRFADEFGRLWSRAAAPKRKGD